MKMLIQIFKMASLACLFFVVNSCDNELNLIEPNNAATPVIYGFLSMGDTATYIRVERSFVDIKRSPIELAKIADSITYPVNVEVYLVRIKSNERYLLQKVDGNTEGYRRDTGAFVTTPNYLYKIKTSTLLLRSNEDWRVEVQRKGETKLIAKAETRIIGNYDITMQPFVSLDPSFPCTFETNETAQGKLDADVIARFYSINIFFNYEETIGATTTKKQLKWVFSPNQARKGTPSPVYDQQAFTQSGRNFYEFLGNNIPVTAGAVRTFKDFDVEVTAGGQEVIDLLNVGIANLGITGSQTIPIYTNVEDGSKVKALGIFGSRNKFTKKGFKMVDPSLELLKNGPYTKQLNFR
jgi:hypothetical protein